MERCTTTVEYRVVYSTIQYTLCFVELSTFRHFTHNPHDSHVSTSFLLSLPFPSVRVLPSPVLPSLTYAPASRPHTRVVLSTVHSKKKSTYPIEKKYLAVKESHSHPVIQPCTPPWTGQRTRVGRVMPYSQIVRSIDIHRRS